MQNMLSSPLSNLPARSSFLILTIPVISPLLGMGEAVSEADQGLLLIFCSEVSHFQMTNAVNYMWFWGIKRGKCLNNSTLISLFYFLLETYIYIYISLKTLQFTLFYLYFYSQFPFCFFFIFLYRDCELKLKLLIWECDSLQIQTFYTKQLYVVFGMLLLAQTIRVKCWASQLRLKITFNSNKFSRLESI